MFHLSLRLLKMNTMKFVTSVWIMSVLLNPLTIYLTTDIVEYGGSKAVGYLIGFGFLFTIPAYVLCVLLFQRIRTLKTTVILKMFAWCLVAAISLLANSCLMYFLFGFYGEIFGIMAWLSLFGWISSVIASLVLYKPFTWEMRLEERDSLRSANDDAIFKMNQHGNE